MTRRWFSVGLLSADCCGQGEVIAHILNGVINKPVRDALLLNHAIDDVKKRNKDDDLSTLALSMTASMPKTLANILTYHY